MSISAHRRLVTELKKLQQSQNEGIDASPDEDNLMQWQAVIYGPQQTVWEGGTFRLKIQFSQDYPNKPPTIVFVSKLFHPNIYNDGKICLDSTSLKHSVLQNKWSPMYDVAALLTSIRSLLSDPNPQSPANHEAAMLYSKDIKEYQKKVREIVELSWKSHLIIL